MWLLRFLFRWLKRKAQKSTWNAVLYEFYVADDEASRVAFKDPKVMVHEAGFESAKGAVAEQTARTRNNVHGTDRIIYAFEGDVIDLV